MKLLRWGIQLSILFSVFGVSSAFAAAVDHFNVTIDPTAAQVGEALDITIEAMDKSNEVVTDYVGTVLVFSESDDEAEFPNELNGNSYEFKPSDQGKVKFENAVKFKNSGKQNIHVYDLADETLMGVAEVDISADSTPQNVEINIISPESGLTIGENKVKVSGTTKKNHRVVISINNTQEETTTSNSEGIFEKEITNLQEGENMFKASVLDSDNKKIGESSAVVIKINSSKPKLISIKVTPQDDVAAQSEVVVEVISDKGLDKVSAIINDIVTPLQETKEGVYLGKTRAPSEAGKYNVDVSLKNELGIESKEFAVASLNVVALNAPDEPKTETQTGTTVTLSAPPDKDPMKITGLKLTELKTKSVLTWDKVDIAAGYNVYKKMEDGSLQLIETVKDPSFSVNITGDEIKHDWFYVRAFANTGSGETYEGDLSDATKIQTGPEMYLLLLIISLMLAGIFYMAKRKVA